MKLNRICYIMVMFVAFTFYANAQETPSTYVVPSKYKVSKLYFDLGFGAIFPIGNYKEPIDINANLNFQPGFSTSASVTYYFNDYIGISTALHISISDTEKYLNTSAYVKSTQIFEGTGVALRYRVSKYFEVFGDAGIAYSIGLVEIRPTNAYVKSYDTSSAFGFYGDAGMRFFIRPVYIFAKVAYLGTTKGNLSDYNAKVDFSGVSALLGVGLTF